LLALNGPTVAMRYEDSVKLLEHVKTVGNLNVNSKRGGVIMADMKKLLKF
jgi:hypothetical protein